MPLADALHLGRQLLVKVRHQECLADAGFDPAGAEIQNSIMASLLL